MITRWTVTIASALAVVMAIGCGSSGDTPQDGTPNETETAGLKASPATLDSQDTRPDSDSQSGEVEDTGAEPSADAPNADQSDEPQPSAESQPSAEETVDRVKADVGVGKAGRSLDEYEGVIVTPAKTLFTVREKAVFQIQIPQALQMYKALNGSNPKTHEEFMSKIIQANNIQLPELPHGDKYVYDPEQGELMVEKHR